MLAKIERFLFKSMIRLCFGACGMFRSTEIRDAMLGESDFGLIPLHSGARASHVQLDHVPVVHDLVAPRHSSVGLPGAPSTGKPQLPGEVPVHGFGYIEDC